MKTVISFWHLDPGIGLFLAGSCLFYFITVHCKISRRWLYFSAAICVIIISMASPLHFLGEKYLFSANMLSGILLVLIAGPLLTAAVPEKNRFTGTLISLSKKAEQAPIVCWLAGVSVMWFWHIPAVFNHMLPPQEPGGPGIHFMSGLMYLHFVSLLAAGMIFSWPVINPYRSHRLGALTGVLYLSTACVFCSLLGLVITFSHPGTYTRYWNITDDYGIVPLIRNRWNLSGPADQQMAGLIMWVPCCFIYLTASMVLLIKWFNRDPARLSESGKTGLDSLEGFRV